MWTCMLLLATWFGVGWGKMPSCPTHADYARPAEHDGLRDINLIYRGTEPRTADDLVPLVAYVDSEGRPQDWFFDAFLLLPAFNAVPGADFHNGPSTMADWGAWLDKMLGEDGLVAALHQAVERAAQQIGPPPRPRRVMLAVPWPLPGQKAFGDLNGDGQPEDLDGEELRWRAVEWFMEEALDRWGGEAGDGGAGITSSEQRRANREGQITDHGPRFLHHPSSIIHHPSPITRLELWGFYWHREEVSPPDEALVQRACAWVHEGGLKMLWIPWFRAPGWDRWRELGFDLAILQPNYAFLPLADGHLPDDGRLAETAQLARGAGLGVEMETNYALATRETDRGLLRLYLNHTVTDGYAGAVRAHFHSFDQYQALARSDQPEARQLYEDLFALYRGELQWRPLSRLQGAQARVVRDDQAQPASELLEKPGEGGEVALAASDRLQIDLPQALLLDEVRLLLDGSFPRALDVYGQEPSGDEWQLLASVAEAPAALPGWLMATWRPRLLQRLQVEIDPFPGGTVGVEQVVSYPSQQMGARAHGRRANGESIGRPANLALGRPYLVRPSHPCIYPDEGGELTDGLLTEQGFPDGRTVGWTAPEVRITLDLGVSFAVEAVRVHLQGGGMGGVHYPHKVSVATSADGARWRLLHREPARRGPAQRIGPEAELAWATVEAAVLRERVRWVRVMLQPYQWLMVSEIEALSGGENVARGVAYTLWPKPRFEAPYPDDGMKLTDGEAAPDWRKAVGWENSDGEVEVDLGAIHRIGRARGYLLGGGAGGVYLPQEVLVSVSRDGVTWSEPAAAELPRAEESGEVMGTWAACDLGGLEARYLKLHLRRSQGWLMVGEVEVLGAAN